MFAANFMIDSESQATLIFAVAIAVLVVGLAGFLWRQMSQKSGVQGRELDESFDGIKEQDNPAPKVMHIVGVATIAFTVWYAVWGYPLFNFSQTEQYHTEVDKYQEIFEKQWEDASDEQLADMGESLFNDKCSACHGLTGDGQNGRAADLIAFGSETHVITVIQQGSQGLNKLNPMMPPQWEGLGETEAERQQVAENIAGFVMTLSGREVRLGDPQAGAEAFGTYCSVCHGPEGKGDGPGGSMLGFAADLTEYGKPTYLKEIIKAGKDGLIGKMPAFGNSALSETQYHALSLFVAQRLVE
ncbi:MAG: c-type cytochrome [bacterium]|nr:c-type cytochrome [bacterium]